MRPFATIAHRSIFSLAVGCTVFALACGGQGSSKPQSGTGGAGTGDTSGTGGAGTAQPDAAITTSTGGSPPGSGGTTTTAGPDAAKLATGGATGTSGLAASGGAGGTQPGSGGTTAVTSVDAGSPATGGRTGTGGLAAGGGRSGGGGQSTGGAPPASGGTGGGGGTSSTPVPSPGCGKTPPASNRYTIDVGGTSREYILKVPDGYDPNHAYRLIFGFHGAKYDDNWVATGKAPDGGTPLSGPYFGIESEAAGSAVFVAPQANPTWSSSDLAFVDAMLALFESQLCIDKSRIFSVGFSMGAIMTITLGCNRSDVFRGIAPMSGSLPSPCPTGQHIAYWASHGTNDTTIPIANGQAARDEFVKRNHCGTQTSAADANHCVTYQGCDQGYPVTWCTFTGVHEPAPFAGPEIWQFIAPL
jgi:poly(3-hydroxybutyrate) depolymerase